MSDILKVIEDGITITKPVNFIYHGDILSIKDDAIVIQAQLYFTEDDIVAEKILEALKNENYVELENYDYYTINNAEYIKLNYVNASQIFAYPKRYEKIFIDGNSDLDKDEQELTGEEAETNTEESEEEQIAIRNVTLLLRFDESAVNEVIIEAYPVVMTASVLLQQYRSFPNTVKNVKDPARLYLLFQNLIENKLELDTYSLYYELIIAQLFYCHDKENLWRLTKGACNNASMLNFKTAIQTLYPIRALYFENLAATIQKLPFLKKQDFATIDNYLIGDYNTFRNKNKSKKEK